MIGKRYTLWIAVLALALLVAAPLAVQAKRPEGVGRPTVTVVPPIPVLPGLPGVPATPVARETPAPPATRAARYGPVVDAQAPWLGPITVLANRNGFQLWYTPTATGEGYTAGDRYHAVFKLRTRCTSGWTAAIVPNRVPYSLTGFAGRQVCYRVSGPDADREAILR